MQGHIVERAFSEPSIHYQPPTSYQPLTQPPTYYPAGNNPSGVSSLPNSPPVDNPAIFKSETTFGDFSSQSERPKLSSRFSTSAISMPKKAFSASKDYMKAHPARTSAFVGGIGAVAEACGVNGASTASKVFLNIQRSRQKKVRPHSLSQPLPHISGAAAVNNENAVPTANAPSPQQVAQELLKIMQQQGHSVAHHANQGTPSNYQDILQQYSNSISQANQQQGFSQPIALPQNGPSTYQQILQQYTAFTSPNNQFPAFPSQSAPQLDGSQPNSPLTDLYDQASNQLQNLQLQDPPIPFPDNQSQIFPDTSLTSEALQLLQQLQQTSTTFPDQSSPPQQLFDTSIFSTDQSTIAYNQLVQALTSTSAANQAILNSQALTSSLTGQDIFAQSGDPYAVPDFQQQDLFDSTSSVALDPILGGDDSFDSF